MAAEGIAYIVIFCLSLVAVGGLIGYGLGWIVGNAERGPRK
jgi:hypothetical protein